MLRLRFTGLMLVAAPLAAGESFRYPEAMGVVDLSREPYRADPTGRTDSSAAINRALAEAKDKSHWLLWLPDGTYRVDKPLVWPGPPTMGPSLQGESRRGTVIRLVDRSPDFQDAKHPQGVLRTGWGSADNFSIDIRHLTIDTGRGNPGACALQYMSNNQGSVRDVTLRSGDGAGVAGLDCAYTDLVGPCWIRDVRVEGFRFGIRSGYNVNSLVLDRIELINQREAGLHNAGQCVSARAITSRNRVPAAINEGAGFLVLLDSELRGGAADAAALVNHAGLLVRNLRTTGYGKAVVDHAGGGERASGLVREYASAPALTLHPGLPHLLGLPVEEAPELPWGDPARWANVVDFGADPQDDQDDTAAIQRAVDSGAEMVCFPSVPPPKGFRIAGTVEVRGKVRRFIGLRGPWELISWIGRGEDPAFRVGHKAQPVVGFTDLCGWDLHGGARPMIGHDGPATVVLRGLNLLTRNSAVYRSTAGAGKAFLEDVCVQFPGSADSGDGPQLIVGGGQVWCRQFNPETKCRPKIQVTAGDLWILGLKTERGSTLVEALGGRTEILGGLCYTTLDPGDQPMLRVAGGELAASLAETGWHQRFRVVVEDERGGERRELRLGQVPGRCGGSVLPLFASRPPQAGAPAPAAPRGLAAAALGRDGVRLTWQVDEGTPSYQVRREGRLLAATRDGVFTERGLPDGVTVRWEVAAVNAALAEAVATVELTTPADRDPPRLLEAESRRRPPQVRLTFDEPIDPDSVEAAAFASEPPASITGRSLVDARTVELSLAAIPAGGLRTVTVSGLRDRARAANAMPQVRMPVRAAVEPRQVFARDFSACDAGRIEDNSGYRGGRVEAGLIDDQRGGKLLRLTVSTFGQAVLGVLPVAAGKRHVIRSRVRTEPPGLGVTLLVRQWDPPWTHYGALSASVSGPAAEEVSGEFIPDDSDDKARLFVICEGNAVIELDDIFVGAYP